ncbi:MAG: hypothetical protein WC860_06940 [Candidatus Margulisiibacteriota bacterium]|jgi:hypothetical protein
MRSFTPDISANPGDNFDTAFRDMNKKINSLTNMETGKLTEISHENISFTNPNIMSHNKMFGS